MTLVPTTVIGRDDHQRPLCHLRLFQGSQHLSDKPVRLFYRGVIHVRSMPVRVAGMVHMVKMDEGQSRPVFHELLASPIGRVLRAFSINGHIHNAMGKQPSEPSPVIDRGYVGIRLGGAKHGKYGGEPVFRTSGCRHNGKTVRLPGV